MKRILITHSYFLRFDPKQWKIMQPYAPLGTLLAAAVSRNAGYETHFFDTMFAKGPDQIVPVLNKVEPEVLVIYDDGFNYLNKMCLTNMREAAFKMIEFAHNKNIPVIVYSSDATDHYDKYLDKGACAVIKGEGEATLIESLNVLNRNENFSETIDGLIYRYEGKTVVNKTREVQKTLDDFPLPAWDLADMQDYKKAWKNKNNYFSINMSTTRGCPFKCNWCAKPIYGNRYNSRSPEHVVKEIALLVEQYQPDHIWFCDDIFGLKPGWVQRFAKLIADAGINIRYKIQSRVDLLLQEDTIAALAASGCESVWVGAESGSQKILDAMDKGTRVEQIFEATNLLKKHGIKPSFFLQFGYPGETKEDIRKTVSMVKTLLPDDIGISISYPLPGTPFHDKVKSQLDLKANWSDSDDLDLMFAGTYAPPYYKHLHRYVHKTYRIHQGYQEIKNLFSGNSTKNTSWKRVAGSIYHQPGKWMHYRKMKKFDELKISDGISIYDNEGLKNAFDNNASLYDINFTDTVTGRMQRNLVHDHLSSEIDPEVYPNVLELNCGTGADAVWMAKQGFNVTATDLSTEMIRIATQKSQNLSPEKQPRFLVSDFNNLTELQDLQYDLIFSNFGGLNCANKEQLKNLAKEATRLLRPGGKFIAVIMGKKCLSESVYFSLKNKKVSNRRNTSNAVSATISGQTFPVWYYSPDEIIMLMKPWLNDATHKPVGLVIPPSFLNKYFERSNLITRLAGKLEQFTPNLPVFSDYADHYLIELTKR